MQLTAFRIFKYRNIEDSGLVKGPVRDVVGILRGVISGNVIISY
jgi:hypothetical protein